MSSETGSGAGHEARDTGSGGSFNGGSEVVPPRTRVRSINGPAAHKDLTIREGAALHVLAHPDADIPPSLKKQIDAAESVELAARIREETTAPGTSGALTAIEDGAESQISASKTLSPGQIRARRAVVAAATVVAAGYAADQAVDHAVQIPDRVVERAKSEIPAEIGTEEVNVFGMEVTVPSIGKTVENREAAIAAAQERLDNTIEGVRNNAIFAVGAVLVGFGADRLAKRGVAPINATRRRLGARKEEQGWQALGTSKAVAQKQFERRRT